MKRALKGGGGGSSSREERKEKDRTKSADRRKSSRDSEVYFIVLYPNQLYVSIFSGTQLISIPSQITSRNYWKPPF